MRRTLRPTVIVLSLLLLVLAGCAAPERPATGAGAAPAAPAAGGDTPGQPERQEAGASVTGQEQQEAGASVADVTRADADLVVWADEARSAALRPLAESFGGDHGVTVAVQAIPFEQIRDQLLVTAPDGDGPDVLVGDHDWLGELVPAGIAAPVDLGDRAGAFADVAVSAVTYDGRTYGVPYAVSSVALVRNTRLVPGAPGDWEEVTGTAAGLQRRGAVSAGVAVPGDPYHLYPFVTALGGYLFGDGADGPDVSDLGIDSPGAVEAAQRFREWAADGGVDFAGSSAEAAERFAAGEAAFAVLDPAAVGPDGEGLAGSGVPYAVSAVPPVDGGTARPFVEVEAVMVSAFADDVELARRFALDHVTAEGPQAALAAAAARPPAHRTAADAAEDDPDLSGFAAAARDGVPLPAVPETGSVWAPWADALEQVREEGADPREALSDAGDEFRGLVGR